MRVIDPFAFGAPPDIDPYAAFVVSYVKYSVATGLVATIGPNPTTNTGTPGINAATVPFVGSPGSLDFSYGTTIVSGLPTIGTQDFVIEFWYYRNSGGDYTLVDMRPTSTQGVYPALLNGGGSGEISLWVSSAHRLTGGALGAFAWRYVALARSAGVTRLYAGTSGTAPQQGSSYTDANNYGGTTLRVGHNRYNFDGTVFDGAMCEVRLTIGTDRGFTGASIPVPTKRFPTT